MFFGILTLNSIPLQAESSEDQTIETFKQDVSSHFHAVITTNNDTFESGTNAIVSVRYTLDQASASSGD